MACTAGGTQDGGSPLPWPEGELPKRGVSKLPEPVRQARAELGRLLFYDPVLSSDRETACASCHSEIWGMGDGLTQSVGHGAGLLTGPGRSGGAVVRRNAPQLWNLAFRSSLFWDGRAESLEAQALEPLRDPDEMARDPEDAVRELRGIDTYVQMFAEAFPESPEPSVPHLASALAEFERGLISLRSLYDGYVAGDLQALGEAQVEGMFRFSELGCTDCHVPPLFEKEAYFDRGLEPAEREDQGRFEVTGKAADRRSFRVPSLRNVAFSEPYFHDGSVMKLADAVRHELEQSGLSYADEDVSLITRFISDALKDESREPERPHQVPSGLAVPIDGTFLAR